jgi:hypothetical protein
MLGLGMPMLFSACARMSVRFRRSARSSSVPSGGSRPPPRPACQAAPYCTPAGPVGARMPPGLAPLASALLRRSPGRSRFLLLRIHWGILWRGGPRGEAALARRFAGVPAWFGRATMAWWAVAGPAGLVSAPTAREVAGPLGPGRGSGPVQRGGGLRNGGRGRGAAAGLAAPGRQFRPQAAARPPRPAAARGRGLRAGTVFTNLNGDPMAPDRLARAIKKLAAQAIRGRH